MRILVSCVPFDHGRSGISVYMRHTVRALARAGHEITLVLEPEAADEPAFSGFPRIVGPRWIGRPVLSMLWHLFILPFRIRRRKYDLFFIAAANRRAVAFRRVPTVAVVHDLAAHRVRGKYDGFRTFYQTKVLPFFTCRAEFPVAISEATAADMVEFLKLPRERIVVSWNGLSLPEVPQTDGFAQRNGLAPGSYILYISRLEHPAKNQYGLIEAYEKLPPELTNRYRLVLGGADWHGAETIRARAAASPLADRILLAGFVPDAELEHAYRGAAAYVFPSLFEGFGLSLIEAMHYGIPCCCSDRSSLGEIGRGAALLFDPEDTDAVAAALKEILESETLRARLAEAGTRRAAEFTWDKHVERIVSAVNSSRKTESRPVLFGIQFDALTETRTLDRIFELAALPPGGRGCRIAVTVNVDFIVNTWHACSSSPRNPELAEVLRRAELVVADGMPLVWLSRLLGTPLPERVAGSDLVPLIAERAAREGVGIYFLGGAEEYTRRAAEILRGRFPGLRIAGIDTPFVKLDAPDAAEFDREICRKINASGAAILFVGFGNPKQELWLERNRKNLDCAIAIGIGGSFNFIAGAVKRAPQWMRRSGMEWIYRVIQEPGRLWKRYGVGLVKFNIMVWGALLNRPRKNGAELLRDETAGGWRASGRGRFSPRALAEIAAAGTVPVRIANLSRRQMRQLRAFRLAHLVTKQH